MNGYIPHEREPISTEQKVAMVASVIACVFLFIAAIAATRWATPLLMKLNFGILPLGILQFVLGATFLVRHDGKLPERPLANDVRSRRIAGIMCIVLGILIVAVWFAGRGALR